MTEQYTINGRDGEPIQEYVETSRAVDSAIMSNPSLSIDDRLRLVNMHAAKRVVELNRMNKELEIINIKELK